jgi:thiaminase/transcriptional activator TenA
VKKFNLVSKVFFMVFSVSLNAMYTEGPMVKSAKKDQKFSGEVIANARKVYAEVKNLEFIKKLTSGELDLNQFMYYIEQDAEFLAVMQPLARTIADMVETKIVSIERGLGREESAARIKAKEYASAFLKLADNECEDTAKKGPDFFFNSFVKDEKFQATGKKTPALVEYVNFFKSVVQSGSVEEIVAAFLPCPWLYWYLAVDIKPSADPKGKYYSWIEAYASESSEQGVKKLLDLFDLLASQASPENRKKMNAAFQKAMELERNFWNDAYHMRAIEAK